MNRGGKLGARERERDRVSERATEQTRGRDVHNNYWLENVCACTLCPRTNDRAPRASANILFTSSTFYQRRTAHRTFSRHHSLSQRSSGRRPPGSKNTRLTLNFRPSFFCRHFELFASKANDHNPQALVGKYIISTRNKHFRRPWAAPSTVVVLWYYAEATLRVRNPFSRNGEKQKKKSAPGRFVAAHRVSTARCRYVFFFCFSSHRFVYGFLAGT